MIDEKEVRVRVVNLNADGRVLWCRCSVPAGSVVDEFGEFVFEPEGRSFGLGWGGNDEGLVFGSGLGQGWDGGGLFIDGAQAHDHDHGSWIMGCSLAVFFALARVNSLKVLMAPGSLYAAAGMSTAK